MATPPRPNLSDVVSVLRAFLAAEYPGSEPERLQVSFRHRGRDEELRYPLAPQPAPAQAPPAAELREEILRGLDEAGGPLKGSALAKRLGRPYSGHFRATLSEMRADGEVLRDADGKFSLPSD